MDNLSPLENQQLLLSLPLLPALFTWFYGRLRHRLSLLLPPSSPNGLLSGRVFYTVTAEILAFFRKGAQSAVRMSWLLFNFLLGGHKISLLWFTFEPAKELSLYPCQMRPTA